MEPFDVLPFPCRRSVPARTDAVPSLLNAPEKVVVPDEDLVTVPVEVFVNGRNVVDLPDTVQVPAWVMPPEPLRLPLPAKEADPPDSTDSGRERTTAFVVLKEAVAPEAMVVVPAPPIVTVVVPPIVRDDVTVRFPAPRMAPCPVTETVATLNEPSSVRTPELTWNVSRPSVTPDASLTGLAPTTVICPAPVIDDDDVYVADPPARLSSAPDATVMDPFDVLPFPCRRSVPARTDAEPSLLNAPEKVVVPDEDLVTVPVDVLVRAVKVVELPVTDH